MRAIGSSPNPGALLKLAAPTAMRIVGNTASSKSPSSVSCRPVAFCTAAVMSSL